MTSGSTRLLTAGELMARGDRSARDELWDGVLLVRSPSGGAAEVVAMRVARHLFAHLEGHPEAPRGWVTGSSQGFLVARDPDRVLSPDVAFTTRARLGALPARGYFPCAPDLAVEVRSPEGTWEATVEKCGIWIAHGVAVAWAVDPEARRVVVFRPRRDPLIGGPGQEVDAEPLLAGFRVRTDDVFVDLDP